MSEGVNGEAGARALGVTPRFRQGRGMEARLGEAAGGMWLRTGLGWKVGEGNGIFSSWTSCCSVDRKLDAVSFELFCNCRLAKRRSTLLRNVMIQPPSHNSGGVSIFITGRQKRH
jgi:hypothetical protein